MKLPLLQILACIALLITQALTGATTESVPPQPVGADVAAAFARARDGQPLRCVALGGSITQAGKGWIGPWLKDQFPESDVTMVNSGMSATGSALGIFRVDRDVIAHQPDLVLIEYCVNDGGATDETAIRNMESLIVRLKSLPNPPAIVIVEAAAKGGVNLSRHRAVAEHYGFVEVDLQQASEAELEKTGQMWDALFSDNVHPNAAGHTLYAKAIEAALEPFLDQTDGQERMRLPEPLSKQPLILDGRMVPLSGISNIEGWRTQNSLPFWWNRFFTGVLSAEAPESTLDLTFQGTTVGLYYAMDKSYGVFYAVVDGGAPVKKATNTRGGYGYTVLADNMPARNHRLTVILPPEQAPELKQNGPVKLGYLLLAGETKATREMSPQGDFTPDSIVTIANFDPLPLDELRWAGPYSLPKADRDAKGAMGHAYPPELGGDVAWQSMNYTFGETINFRELLGSKEPVVTYLSFDVTLEEAADCVLVLYVDYFAKIWVNGELQAEVLEPHGSPKEALFLPLQLTSGENQLLVKVGAGSAGNEISLGLCLKE